MGGRSITGGVRAKGSNRIQFDFELEGMRYRPAVERIPSEANLRRARKEVVSRQPRTIDSASPVEGTSASLKNPAQRS